LEAAYADMARRAGLHVAPTRLIPTERGPGYFATRRFDRLDHGGRLHVASLAGLFDLDWTIPQIDYDQALRMTRAVTRDQESVRDMFVRMVFNVFAHNRDDHAKQHAFAMSRRGEWSLAPAYDLTFSRGPGGQHYLSVDGHGGDDITIAAMRRLGESQGIARKAIDEIVTRVGDAVASFSTFAGNYDVSKTTMSLVGEALDRNLRRLLGLP
jgi:serine/threonine-protein kinase HipA